jgi:uncharacterized protein
MPHIVRWSCAGLAVALLLLALLAGGAFLEARALPIVRRAEVGLPDWPPGQPPVTVALVSDLHVGNAATDPARLARVVAEIDDLHPDLVLIAGDFLPGRRPLPPDRVARLLAPLAGLHTRLGVAAVLGNHDYWTEPGIVRTVLQRNGVTVLSNQAVERGPLAVGGIDDPVTGHARARSVAEALRALPGARILVAHSPEIVDELPRDPALLLAGHTHCGQMRLPLIDPEGPRWRYRRYECGVVHDPGRTTIVTAGVGTSVVPLRVGAPPDLWLATLHPASARP